MDVPAVNKSVIWCGKPAHRPAAGIKTSPAPTAEITTGMLLELVMRSSPKLSFAATQTIPVCNTILVAYVIPGLNAASEYPTVFFTVIPRRIDNGMPETGKTKAEETIEATVKPPTAVAAESARPGTIDGGAVGFFCSLSSSSLDGGGAAVNVLAGWIHRTDLMDRRKALTELVLVRSIDMIDVYH
jgi:hypothetical protein